MDASIFAWASPVLIAIGVVSYRDIRNTPEWVRTLTVTPPDDIRTIAAPTDPNRPAITSGWYQTGGN